MIGRRDALGHAAAALAIGAGLPAWARALGVDERRATAPRSYLDAALRAERWIARSAVRDGRGLTWPADPRDPATVQQNLYSGSPGVLLFYLELHAATGDAAYLATAQRAADYLVSTLPVSAPDLGAEGAGLYTGIAGVAYALSATQVAGRDARYRAPVQRALQLLRDAVGDGAAFNDSTDVISGTSGVLFTLMHLERRDPTLADFASWRAVERRGGRRRIDVGVAEQGGLKWAIHARMPRRYPNFSHGTAGVGTVLAQFAAHDRDTPESRAALEAALGGARYLAAIATLTADGGRKVFHSEPGGESLYYLSWCHGPAGMARLYRQLETSSRDPRWRAYLPQLAQGIIGSGVPEQHPDRSGYWNNISQCCGNCGVAEFFLDLHAESREAAHLAFARRVMDNVLGRGTDDGDTTRWVQAENRVSPEDVVAQTGLMQGAAGVGLALLHLDGALTRRTPVVRVPDHVG